MAKAQEKQIVNPVEVIRNGWLAYIGLYGTAYERVKPRFENLGEKTADLFGELVEKGETIEATAQDHFADARERATGIYGNSFEKVRDFMPKMASNDRVQELEDEIDALNKKIATLSKKTAAKKTARKTTKSAKAA